MPKKEKLKKYICEVKRLEQDELHIPITLNVSISDKPMRSKRFMHGDRVELNEAEINALHDACVETQVEIPHSSDIYRIADKDGQKAKGQEMYPGMKAYHYGPSLVMISKRERFNVKIISEVT